MPDTWFNALDQEIEELFNGDGNEIIRRGRKMWI